jgi:hypothetical protein
VYDWYVEKCQSCAEPVGTKLADKVGVRFDWPWCVQNVNRNRHFRIKRQITLDENWDSEVRIQWISLLCLELVVFWVVKLLCPNPEDGSHQSKVCLFVTDSGVWRHDRDRRCTALSILAFFWNYLSSWFRISKFLSPAFISSWFMLTVIFAACCSLWSLLVSSGALFC